MVPNGPASTATRPTGMVTTRPPGPQVITHRLAGRRSISPVKITSCGPRVPGLGDQALWCRCRRQPRPCRFTAGCGPDAVAGFRWRLRGPWRSGPSVSRTIWRAKPYLGFVLVGEDLWAPLLLAGSTVAEVGDRFDGDVLGADPRAAWAAASAEAVRAVEADGAMERIIHLSFGDFPGREYAMQLFADHLIHAWEKARAIGADERPDAGLVTSCASWFDALEDVYANPRT
jgi:hypothetical protein